MHSYFLMILAALLQGTFFLPINQGNRHAISDIHLTEIGEFGLKRKARPTVPAHYHTGIDIKRPGNNYHIEPIFPIAAGKVISKRTDGPYANLILEHTVGKIKIWTLYEHIADIKVAVGNEVTPFTPIARFMNKEELNRYGWQFDHFHLEILKVKPQALKPTAKYPERYYNSYSLVCYSKKELSTYFFNPVAFLSDNL